MIKDEIRKSALAVRDALSREDIETKSRKIFEKVTSLDGYAGAENILVYASMRSEVVTDDIILDAFVAGKKVFCPKVTDVRKGEMIFVPIEALEDLAEGDLGIREPEVPEGYQEPEFDEGRTLVIMPGVAFDRERNRIGYSGGFYDRFLSGHPELDTVAVCFECQICGEPIPVMAHDMRPMLLITEDNIY